MKCNLKLRKCLVCFYNVNKVGSRKVGCIYTYLNYRLVSILNVFPVLSKTIIYYTIREIYFLCTQLVSIISVYLHGHSYNFKNILCISLSNS